MTTAKSNLQDAVRRASTVLNKNPVREELEKKKTPSKTPPDVAKIKNLVKTDENFKDALAMQLKLTEMEEQLKTTQAKAALANTASQQNAVAQQIRAKIKLIQELRINLLHTISWLGLVAINVLYWFGIPLYGKKLGGLAFIGIHLFWPKPKDPAPPDLVINFDSKLSSKKKSFKTKKKKSSKTKKKKSSKNTPVVKNSEY